MSRHGHSVKPRPASNMRMCSVATTLDEDEVRKLTNVVFLWVFTVIFQLGALHQEALEVASLIQSVRNRRAPINRLPRDVFALIPGFWGGRERGIIAIALTHVCRAWREIFISLASLWTNLCCVDAEKTRSYLERSKSAPISLCLERLTGLFSNDPFLEVAPRITHRLKYLSVKTTPGHFQDVTQHLVHPAPLLEALTMDASCLYLGPSCTLKADFFDGDLASLRELHLFSVNTQLPWRNMNNLTSFSLAYTARSTVSVDQILDFLESAPRLLKIKLLSAALAPGAQDSRLITLTHLRRLTISGSQKPSLLLNHLIIPVGAKVSTVLAYPGPSVDDHLPRSLGNLRNLSHFTKVRLYYKSHRPPTPPSASIQFTGPNGQVSITSSCPTFNVMSGVPRSLASFDTSRIECLEIIGSDFTTELRQALLPLENLRTLVFSGSCTTVLSLLALDPASSHGLVVCPRLEELILYNCDGFCVDSMAELAAARASRGAPLKLLKIAGIGEPARTEVTELLKHVLRVEITPWEKLTKVDGEDDPSDEDSDEDDSSNEDSDEDDPSDGDSDEEY